MCVKIKVPFTNSLDAQLDIEKPMSFVIDAKTVETILADMMFVPENDDGEVSKQHALSMFKRNIDNSYTIENQNLTSLPALL